MRTCRNRSRCIVRNVFNNTYEPTLSVHLVHARHKRGGGDDYFDVPIMNSDQMVRISALHTGANVTDSDLLRIQQRWRKSCNRRGVVRPYPELGKEADVIIPYPELSKNESCPYFTIHTSSVDKQGVLRLGESNKLVCQLLLDKKDIVQRVTNGRATLYFYSIRVHNRDTNVHISERKAEWLRCNGNNNLIGNVTHCYTSSVESSMCTSVISVPRVHYEQSVKEFTYNFENMSLKRIEPSVHSPMVEGVLQVREDGKRVYSTDAEKEDEYMKYFRDKIVYLNSIALHNKYVKNNLDKQNQQKEHLIEKILEDIVNRMSYPLYPLRGSTLPPDNYDKIKKYKMSDIQSQFPNKTPIAVDNIQYEYVIKDEPYIATYEHFQVPSKRRQIIVDRANAPYIKFIFHTNYNADLSTALRSTP